MSQQHQEALAVWSFLALPPSQASCLLSLESQHSEMLSVPLRVHVPLFFLVVKYLSFYPHDLFPYIQKFLLAHRCLLGVFKDLSLWLS